MAIKYLTFDCYGTLIDWKTGIETNFKKFFLKDKGGVLSTGIFSSYVVLEAKEEKAYKAYRDILTDTSLRLAENLGLEQSETAARKFADSITHWPAFEDTAPALKELGRRGYKRIILSNIDRNLLKETIKNNNLEVDDFITAQDVKSYKPEKKHWITFLKSFKTRKEKVLHVANGIYHDIVPASELGLKTAWVNRYGEELPEDVKPSYVIDRVSDLLDISEL